jgi:hypothetical protein
MCLFADGGSLQQNEQYDQLLTGDEGGEINNFTEGKLYRRLPHFHVIS